LGTRREEGEGVQCRILSTVRRVGVWSAADQLTRLRFQSTSGEAVEPLTIWACEDVKCEAHYQMVSHNL
jgi:hypothetical protein